MNRITSLLEIARSILALTSESMAGVCHFPRLRPSPNPARYAPSSGTRPPGVGPLEAPPESLLRSSKSQLSGCLWREKKPGFRPRHASAESPFPDDPNPRAFGQKQDPHHRRSDG